MYIKKRFLCKWRKNTLYAFEILSVVCNAFLETSVEFLRTAGKAFFRYRIENHRHMALNASERISPFRCGNIEKSAGATFGCYITPLQAIKFVTMTLHVAR